LLVVAVCACAPKNLTTRESVGGYEYRIGPGDRLKVTTYNEQRLSGEFAVGANGAVSFPLAGDIAAKGKTVGEFRDELERRLGSEFLRNPRVAVEVLNFRPVYILGEIAKPGEFPYADRMSIFALVAKAGGFTYRANKSFAYIRREDETEEKAVRLTSATAVFPGDTIRIPERTF
jgi:polysaccharide export outer membrane protein